MRKFKRALSSVLAFVMVFSMMTVINVYNIFAADLTGKPTVETSLDGLKKTTTWDLTFWAGQSSNKSLTDGYALSTGLYIVNDPAAGSNFNKANPSYMAFKHDSTKDNSQTAHLYIPVTENSTGGTLTLTMSGKNVERYLNLADQKINYDNTTPQSVEYTSENFTTVSKETGKFIELTNSTGEVRISEIKLEEDLPPATPSLILNVTEAEVPVGGEFQLIATKSLIDEEVIWSKNEDGSANINVDTNGKVTVTKEAKAGETAEITAKASTYTAKATITVRDAINKTWDFNDESWQNFTFEGSAESATSKVNDDLTVGFAAAASGITIKAEKGHLNLGATGNCYFEYTAPGKGTLVYSVINSGITKKSDQESEVSKEGARTLKINGESQGYTSTGEYNYYTQIVSLEKNETYRVQGDSNGFNLAALQFVEDVATVTEPGTGIIQKTKDLGTNLEKTMPSSNVGVYSAGDGNYYAVSVIPSADITKYSQVKQKSGYKQEVASSDTVYTKVDIDGEKTAEDFGGESGDYVYASKIEGATGVGADILVKAITSVLVPVAE